jgi:cation transport regulator
MRFETKSDLPEPLRKYLPEELQEIYLEAYKEAWEKNEEHPGDEASRENVAHRVAMHVVKQDYTYVEEEGKWYEKGEVPEETEEEEGGIFDAIEDALRDVFGA